MSGGTMADSWNHVDKTGNSNAFLGVIYIEKGCVNGSWYDNASCNL